MIAEFNSENGKAIAKNGFQGILCCSISGTLQMCKRQKTGCLFAHHLPLDFFAGADNHNGYDEWKDGKGRRV